jgi:transcriptional regulator with XRE-family HTH domain
MATKSQHAPKYAEVPGLLRKIRQEAGLTQREIGRRLGKPQSWIYNCETLNRRVDVAEFCAWCEACDVAPVEGVAMFLKATR